MTKTKAKREPTYLLDCVLPPTDVTADGFLAKHRLPRSVLQKRINQRCLKRFSWHISANRVSLNFHPSLTKLRQCGRSMAGGGTYVSNHIEPKPSMHARSKLNLLAFCSGTRIKSLARLTARTDRFRACCAAQQRAERRHRNADPTPGDCFSRERFV